MLVSGYLTFYEILTIGSLFAFQNYTSLLWEPGEFLMSYSSSYQEVKPILEKIEYLLNKRLVNYNEDKIRSIYLENFSVLNKKQEKLFKPINYSFELGKTSLIEAILGFNKRYVGKILINGSEEKFNDFVYISADNYISSFYSNSLYKSSSGEKKMKRLELYLKNKKTVYIIDEPTNFVDKSNKKLVYEMVNNLKSNNNIIILISHDENISLYVDKILDFS